MAVLLNHLHMPQVMKGIEDAPRRIGVELEMSGLSIDVLSQEVAAELNLQIEKTSRYQYTLKGDDAGDWIVELDFRLLKEMGEQERDDKAFASDIEGLLRSVSKPLVPHELVSPPLPFERLSDVQLLIERLRKAGAAGTSDSILNAFSVQLNPEVPALDVATITRYLKAFLCLYDWLYHQSSINVTRRITTYVDPFPKKYVQKVLADDYWPQDFEVLIRDYLVDNPTRNRALDMLPLFSHIDDKLVEEYTQDPLIKSRPAFHYRLPNCEIHLPHWGIHLAWNGWLQVEALANDEGRLRHCALDYSHWLQSPWWKRLVSRKVGPWHKRLDSQWVVNVSD